MTPHWGRPAHVGFSVPIDIASRLFVFRAVPDTMGTTQEDLEEQVETAHTDRFAAVARSPSMVRPHHRPEVGSADRP
jgi:hypothetical protein